MTSSSLYFRHCTCWFLIILSSATNCLSLVPSSSSSKSGLLSSSPELEALVSKGLLAQPLPNLYILGTIHIGSKSANDVKFVLNTVQPSKVIVELPPSRLSTMSKSKLLMKQDSGENDDNKQQVSSKKSNTSVMKAFGSLPSLAAAGLSFAGIPGMMVTVGLLWSSLVKQTWSMKNAQGESEVLERCNEFEAAVVMADIVDASVVAADWELEELVQRLASSLTILDWVLLLWGGLFLEPLGIQPPDPLQRKPDESATEWEERRRDISTARASLQHAQRYTPAVDRVLVDQRNQHFANLCLKEVYSQLETAGEESVENRLQMPTVCVVGLAHLDGVSEICRNEAENRWISSSS